VKEESREGFEYLEGETYYDFIMILVRMLEWIFLFHTLVTHSEATLGSQGG